MNDNVKSFIAGGLAGCAAKTVIAPLDRVKILFQTNNPNYSKYSGSFFGVFLAMKKINEQNGMLGLFQGHSATLARIFPYAAIKFMSYEKFKLMLMPSQEKETPWRRALAGSLAGVTSVFFSYPLELIRVRLAFHVKSNTDLITPTILSTCKSIFNEPKTLFSNHQHHLNLDPHVVVSSTHHANLKNTNLTSDTHTSHINDTMTTSNSKNISTHNSSATIHEKKSSNHLASPNINDNLKKSSESPKRLSLSRIILGISNFYRGFNPTIYGMIPYAGVSFMTYETLKDLCLHHPVLTPYTINPQRVQSEEASNNNIQSKSISTDSTNHSTTTKDGKLQANQLKLRAWTFLACGALSGALAQTASYPFEVIRRNLQVATLLNTKRPLRNTVDAVQHIYTNKGMRGFFVGLSIGYLKVAPMFAVSFFAYEWLKNMMGLEK